MQPPMALYIYIYMQACAMSAYSSVAVDAGRNKKPSQGCRWARASKERKKEGKKKERNRKKMSICVYFYCSSPTKRPCTRPPHHCRELLPRSLERLGTTGFTSHSTSSGRICRSIRLDSVLTAGTGNTFCSITCTPTLLWTITFAERIHF